MEKWGLHAIYVASLKASGFTLRASKHAHIIYCHLLTWTLYTTLHNALIKTWTPPCVTFVQIRYTSDIEMAVYGNAQHEWKRRSNAPMWKQWHLATRAQQTRDHWWYKTTMFWNCISFKRPHRGGQHLREPPKCPSRQHGKQQMSSVCRKFGSRRTCQTAPAMLDHTLRCIFNKREH